MSYTTILNEYRGILCACNVWCHKFSFTLCRPFTSFSVLFIYLYIHLLVRQFSIVLPHLSAIPVYWRVCHLQCTQCIFESVVRRTALSLFLLFGREITAWQHKPRERNKNKEKKFVWRLLDQYSRFILIK